MARFWALFVARDPQQWILASFHTASQAGIQTCGDRLDPRLRGGDGPTCIPAKDSRRNRYGTSLCPCSLLIPLPGELVGVEDDGEGAIVVDLDHHHGPKLAGLYTADAGLPESLGKGVDQWASEIR